MNKRTVSAALWFYAGWTFGALIATTLGLSEMLGPAIGLAAAAIFVGNPRGAIWAARPAGSRHRH